MQYEELQAAKGEQSTPQPSEGDADTSFSLSSYVSSFFGFGKGSPQESPLKLEDEEVKGSGKGRLPSPLKLASFQHGTKEASSFNKRNPFTRQQKGRGLKKDHDSASYKSSEHSHKQLEDSEPFIEP